MKKITSILIAGSIAVSCLSPFAGAMEIVAHEMPAVEDAIIVQNEPTTEMMEAMIKKVRPLINVPEEYTEFNWSFNAASVYNTASWQFSWYNHEDGEIYVNCDNQGRIYNYRHYTYGKTRNPILPDISPSVFEKNAREFIARTAPHTKDISFELEHSARGNLYSNTYSYTFLRHENSIPVPGEQITVELNYVTGEVTHMSCSFTNDVEFKKPENVISEDKAKEILSQNQSMALSYRLKTEYDDDGNIVSRKAYLIYTPEVGYVSVDAETGEVYTERNTWTVLNRAPTNGAFGNIMMDSVAKEESAEAEGSGDYQLSEKELEQLAVLESLISKDEAIGIVKSNSDLYIDPVATVVKAYLRKNVHYGVRPLSENAEQDEKYTWNIEFSAPETMGYDYPYYYHAMSAVVDASTGELISFYAEVPDYYYYQETGKDAPELKITEEQATENAFGFIKKLQPEKAENTVVGSINENIPFMYIESDDGKRTPVYGVKRINFVRQNEGIDFTYNSFRVSVELVTGKITNYGYTWYDDVEFESPKDVISANEALMALYSYDGFGVNYEVNANHTYNEYLLKEKQGEIIDYDELFDTALYTRAVYSAYNQGTNIIRAIDGKMIDYSGEEYTQNAFAFSYDDIDSHWAKENIERFSWLGIGFEGESFMPDKQMSREEFETLCNSAGLYFHNLKEDDGDEKFTRMDAVALIIELLGYGKVARLENVFITDFVDNSDFLAEDVGYAAIARGFGLIEGDGENFRPYDALTRAEAYTITANVIDLGILNN